MDAEVRDWLDRIAIQDLINRYSDAVTRADWAQCEAVFAPGAVWECPPLGLHYDSATAFVDTLRATTGIELLIQTPQAPVVTLLGADRARATTTIHEMNRGVAPVDSVLATGGAPINIDMYGIYYDDIARIDGLWKFTRRRFVPVYMAQGGVAGDVVTSRSELSG